MNHWARVGVGAFFAAGLVAVVAGPVVLWAATQAAQKDQPSSATSKPAVGKDKKDSSDQPPQLRFLAWQAEEEGESRETPAAWKPDGKPVTNQADLNILQQIDPGRAGIAPGETWRFVQLWFSHPDIDREFSASVTILDAAGKAIVGPDRQGSTSRLRGEPGNPDDSGWVVVMCSPGKAGDIPKTVDVVLRYSVGPWEEIGTLGVVFEYPAKLDGVTAEGTEETTLDRATAGRWGVAGAGLGNVTVTTLRTTRDHDVASRTQLDVIAVMIDDSELPRGLRMSSNKPDEGEKASFRFDAPRPEIKQFKFRTRPIREVTFKNVPLGPGATTTKPAAK